MRPIWLVFLCLSGCGEEGSKKSSTSTRHSAKIGNHGEDLRSRVSEIYALYFDTELEPRQWELIETGRKFAHEHPEHPLSKLYINSIGSVYMNMGKKLTMLKKFPKSSEAFPLNFITLLAAAQDIAIAVAPQRLLEDRAELLKEAVTILEKMTDNRIKEGRVEFRFRNALKECEHCGNQNCLRANLNLMIARSVMKEAAKSRFTQRQKGIYHASKTSLDALGFADSSESRCAIYNLFVEMATGLIDSSFSGSLADRDEALMDGIAERSKVLLTIA